MTLLTTDTEARPVWVQVLNDGNRANYVMTESIYSHPSSDLWPKIKPERLCRLLDGQHGENCKQWWRFWHDTLTKNTKNFWVEIRARDCWVEAVKCYLRVGNVKVFMNCHKNCDTDSFEVRCCWGLRRTEEAFLLPSNQLLDQIPAPLIFFLFTA